MSEYDYQNPTFVDITDEFLSTVFPDVIPTAIPTVFPATFSNSTVQLAPNYDLVEAVSSIDVPV
jgi:hypothetical protein